MKQKTLIIIHPHFTIPGGAGKVALELGKQLSRDMRVILIAQKINPNYINEYPELEFESINGPITSSFFFWLLFPLWYFKTARIINFFKKQGEISILCNVFPANWFGLLYKIFHKKIHCTWFCHEPSAFIHIKKWRNSIVDPSKRMLANIISTIMSVIDKKLVTYVDEIFVNSKYSQDIAENIYDKKGVIIYPGVDTEKYKPVSFEEKGNYILSLGRISKFKNLDILLSAFWKMENEKISLYVVGDGEEKENLQNLAKKFSMEDRVKFFSNISDQEVVGFYAKAKVFVLCSKNEPFGIVPIEAMACGTAVIADNSGGPMETIVNNETGELIDCDVKNLRVMLEKLLSNNELLKKYSTQARKHIEMNFSWKQSAEKIKPYI